MLFSVLIVTFGILTLISAINLSLLRITHICSEDPHIDCYPQLITGANDTITSLFNITINTNEPILDCSFWNMEGISSQITFTCFQYVFNADVFFAAVGGLLTTFMIAMKFSTGLFLMLNECCECCRGCCVTCKHITRAICALIATAVEIGLVITCLVLGSSGVLFDNEGNSTLQRFIALHAVDILVVFGVIATMLLLPWEWYVDKDEHETVTV